MTLKEAIKNRHDGSQPVYTTQAGDKVDYVPIPDTAVDGYSGREYIHPNMKGEDGLPKTRTGELRARNKKNQSAARDAYMSGSTMQMLERIENNPELARQVRFDLGKKLESTAEEFNREKQELEASFGSMDDTTLEEYGFSGFMQRRDERARMQAIYDILPEDIDPRGSTKKNNNAHELGSANENNNGGGSW